MAIILLLYYLKILNALLNNDIFGSVLSIHISLKCLIFVILFFLSFNILINSSNSF